MRAKRTCIAARPSDQLLEDPASDHCPDFLRSRVQTDHRKAVDHHTNGDRPLEVVFDLVRSYKLAGRLCLEHDSSLEFLSL